MHLTKQPIRCPLTVRRLLVPKSNYPPLAYTPAEYHSSVVNGWEFARFAQAGAGLRDFDVLLEAKAGDLALLRLCADLARYASTVYALSG